MDKTDKKQSFLSHLEELRWVFVRCFTGIVICSILAFIFSDFIFDQIIFAPKNTDFPTYTIYRNLAETLSMDTTLFATEFNFELQNRKMEGQLSVLIWTCFSFGVMAAFPLIMFEFWKYISPALYKNEKKYGLLFLSSASLLFFIGVLFGYYVIVPLSINFLSGFSISDVIENQIDVNSYISLVRTTLLASGVVFNLPVIIYFLYRTGLISTAFLKEYRRYAYVIILIASAVITPPDILSQVILVIPMAILYEASIYLTSTFRLKTV